MLWAIGAVIVLLLVFAPAFWVRWVMHAHNTQIEGMPGTGGELAQHLAQRFDLDIEVESTEMGDHYDPSDKAVRLSPENFSGKSLTAIAVAAHEVGHAIQHHQQDPRLALRSKLVPLADRIGRLSTGFIWAAPIVGILTRHPVPFSALVLVGVSGLLARMLVHLVTLPIEFDASFNKALPLLQDGQYIAPGEEHVVRRILRAAALTYVAAALADVLNLARWASILLRR